VGSRQASNEGLRAASEIAKALVKRDVTIVSGLAAGIDTAAHVAAIDGGGRTIAVLGTPLDRVYPAQNARLQDTIMAEHCAVSQFKLGLSIQRKNFVIRNRTMALICDASVIIEGGESSGTRHQGWEALRLGRPLFLWHSLLRNPSLRWPRKMLDYGAVEYESPDSIINELPTREPILTV